MNVEVKFNNDYVIIKVGNGDFRNILKWFDDLFLMGKVNNSSIVKPKASQGSFNWFCSSFWLGHILDAVQVFIL